MQTADSVQPVAGLGRTGSELGSAKVTSSQGWHAQLTVQAAFFSSGTISGTARTWCGSSRGSGAPHLPKYTPPKGVSFSLVGSVSLEGAEPLYGTAKSIDCHVSMSHIC